MKATKIKATAKFGADQKPNNEIEEKIVKAIQISERMKKDKAELEELKQDFLELFGDGRSEKRIVTSSGAVILKETNSYSVLAEYAPELKKAFKADYGAYVTEKVSYGATAALKSKLSDGDFKHSRLIREAVEITTRNSVEFEAIKAIAKVTKRKTA